MDQLVSDEKVSERVLFQLYEIKVYVSISAQSAIFQSLWV